MGRKMKPEHRRRTCGEGMLEYLLYGNNFIFGATGPQRHYWTAAGPEAEAAGIKVALEEAREAWEDPYVRGMVEKKLREIQEADPESRRRSWAEETFASITQ